MRAQCCICSEHFVNDPSVAIAAVPCGHTFHDECLSKWLDTANTCPSCRSHVHRGRVIKRLYFDGGEEGSEETEDYGKLSNEIQNLRVSLTEREKEKNNLSDDNESLRKHLKDVKKEKKDLEKVLKQEESSISTLKKQLDYLQTKQVAIDREKQECRAIKQKFIQYQNIERMLKDSGSDIQEMLDRYDCSTSSMQNLVMQCTLLKREYDKVKVEKKTIKTEFEKYKRENFAKDQELKDLTSEITLLRENYRRSEDELKSSEKEVSMLKRKINHLRKAITSPHSESVLNPSKSFLETLSNDSPAVVSSVTTPVLFNDSTNSGREVDLDEPHRNPVSPEILKGSSSSSQVKNSGNDENSVRYLKISSASSGRTANPAKKLKLETQSNLSTMNSFNIFKKKSGIGDYSSKIRTGYNGFGGVETFTQPSGKPKLLTTKKSVSRTSGKGKLIKVPPLPTLDDFISID